MVVRGTSIIDVGGVAGCRNACEDQCGEEWKHACKRLQSITLLCPKLTYVNVMNLPCLKYMYFIILQALSYIQF